MYKTVYSTHIIVVAMWYCEWGFL